MRLRHPLLAEAIRARLVAGEAKQEHRRLATALARSPGASASEVAEHWSRADAPVEELDWRIRAARAAEERFALAQAADQWRRVLALWPDGAESAGSPALNRSCGVPRSDGLPDVHRRRRRLGSRGRGDGRA